MNELIDARMVSNNLKSARVRCGYVQDDVAKLLGVTRQSIVNYEAHPENLKLWQYMKLAELYGCSIGYFFGM